jgi:hypothetical protein
MSEAQQLSSKAVRMSERAVRKLVLIEGVLYIPERAVRKLVSQGITSHYLYIESVVHAQSKSELWVCNE